MGAADKIFERNLALVQPHVPEPIRAVAVFQRKGSFGSQLWGAAGVRGMQIAEWEAGKRRAHAVRSDPAARCVVRTDAATSRICCAYAPCRCT